MSISKEEFVSWKNMKETQLIIERLKEQKEYIEQLLDSEGVLLGDPKIIARLVGQREALDMLIALEPTKIFNSEEITEMGY